VQFDAGELSGELVVNRGVVDLLSIIHSLSLCVGTGYRKRFRRKQTGGSCEEETRELQLLSSFDANCAVRAVIESQLSCLVARRIITTFHLTGGFSGQERHTSSGIFTPTPKRKVKNLKT
jgi:hypothetical protein